MRIGGTVVLLLLGLGTLAGCGGGAEAPAPVEEPEPVEEAPPAPEPEPARPAPPPAPPPPITGALQVEGTEGASVSLGGRVLGTVPGAWEELEAGEYPIRVEKEGFHPLEVNITIRGGRTRSLAADLIEMLGSITVESDVAGANVFLNRNFKGNTPVTIADLQPGEYNLTVAVEGRDVVSRKVEVGRRAVPVRVEFGDLVAALEVRVAVVHKHRFGSCEGTLVATPEGFDYQTDHKDAFRLSFGETERFEIDYLENNLRLKVQGGRTYNFESPTEDVDSLFVFHRDVTAFREQG
ncbi:MAG: PEGA domain-containing protein [Acidobacteriota bacterium]|nr:PEGA domain-containing protein [Acidobacteriota bacterium]